jgi:hypothetical protein
MINDYDEIITVKTPFVLLRNYTLAAILSGGARVTSSWQLRTRNVTPTSSQHSYSLSSNHIIVGCGLNHPYDACSRSPRPCAALTHPYRDPTVGPLRMPIEIKGQWHTALWQAADQQLAELYAKDWRADGHGIYLVLWFGDHVSKNKRLRGPPRGTNLLRLIA